MQFVCDFTDTQFIIYEQFFHQFYFLCKVIFLNSDAPHFGKQFTECTVFLVAFVLQIVGQVHLLLIFWMADEFNYTNTDLFNNTHPFVVNHLKAIFLKLVADNGFFFFMSGADSMTVPNSTFTGVMPLFLKIFETVRIHRRQTIFLM